MTMPISWEHLLLAGLIMIPAVWIWKWRARRNNVPPAGIVLFLRRPKPLNAQILAHLLSQVTGRTISAGSPDELAHPSQPADIVLGQTPHFVAFAGDTVFAIHNLSVPYMDDPEAASHSVQEMRTGKAIREHQAWLSMDVISPKPPTAEAYRTVARLLARLIDEDCLLLYHPPVGRFIACVPDDILPILTGDNPLDLFQSLSTAPVIPADDDPRLKAAEAEARRRFSEFEHAFHSGDGTMFTIKTLIVSGDAGEHIWVDVDRIVDGRIEGRLGNDPVNLDDLRLGSKVNVEISSVEDWVFLRNGEPVGAFTPRILQQIERERSQQR
ncbi:MAG: DUF2314 domain-containing protein [Bryobacterales bacterium]|nr:DUF2314 domain-containing protein [Bryobacterales bacterium]